MNRLWFVCLLLMLAPISHGQAVELGGSTDMGNPPKVNVAAPELIVPLHERNPRIHKLRSFQSMVDAAAPGSTLRPAPGTYAGPVHLTKQLIIDGGGKVTIDGGDKGTVFVVQTNGASLRGVHLTGSGSNHDTDDACLNVRGHNNLIEDNKIDNCLFGIDLKQSNNNIVRRNHVRSKQAELGAHILAPDE